MGEWKEYKLGDLIVGNKGCYEIAAPAVDYDRNKYTYLRITDINDDGTINKSNLKSVDDKNADNYILYPNDIVFARTGASVGRSYFYEEKDGVLVYAGFLIKFSIDSKKVNPKILKYYTHSQPYYDWIQTVDNGATRGNINAQIYASMPVLLPERKEQDKIVSILSSLDDKIDLLYRENKTLEAMAETLFNKTLSEKENNGTIEQLISIQNGYAFKSKDFQERGVNGVIKIKNISGGVIDINKTDCVGNDIIQGISSKFKVHTGDILIAMTGAEIGKLGIIPSTNKDLWLNQRVGMLVERYPGAKYIAYLQLRSDYGLDYVENTATGSAQPNISSSAIENCGFPLLDVSEIKALAYQLEGLYEKIIHNLGHINGLKLLRNELLLKLMNSQV